jgi:hypothetical protein
MLLIDRSRVVEVGWTGGAEGSDSEGTSERADSDGRSGFKVRWYPRKLPGMRFIPRLDGGLGQVTTWPGLGHRKIAATRSVLKARAQGGLVAASVTNRGRPYSSLSIRRGKGDAAG